jgi:hypothetical protein
MEIFGLIFVIFSGIIPIAIIGVIIYFIINLSKRKEGVKFSTKTFFQVYLYFMAFITLAILVVAGTTAIKAAASYPFGIDFSYTLYKANDFVEQEEYETLLSREGFQECYEGEVKIINETRYCVNYSQRITDLVNGITIFLSMTILFLIHNFAIRKINKKDKITWLPKIYNFASLILYSLIGIIAIPVSIYQLTNFFLFNKQISSYATPEAPAMALSITILVIPLWIFFLKQTAKLKENQE